MIIVDFGDNCRWCGHKIHTEPCPEKIQTGPAKDPKLKPCPCVQHEKATTK